jgi:hypothetical protein
MCQPIGQHSRALFLLRVLCRRHGVIRFQHRWKINSILIRNTVAPIAVRRTSGRCSLKGRQITENRSCYEHHPSRPSKTVRTAVGCSIFPAASFGRTSKPAASERESAGCRACPIQKKNPPGGSGRLETFTDSVSAGPKPRAFASNRACHWLRPTSKASISYSR